MLTIINDCHLGAKRTSGATKESNKALTAWQQEQFQRLLDAADGDLLINGDLFDKYEVSKQVEFDTFARLSEWLTKTGNRLYLAAGNHDLSTNSEKRSSFENLCQYLQVVHFPQVVKIQGSLYTHNLWAVIPHMPNQTLFEQELDKFLKSGKQKYLFLHCNLMSPFAEHSDHSLNLSEEYLEQLNNKGVTVVLAHEHNGRQTANAVVVGNQIPTSVSDCLDPNGKKQYATLDSDGLHLHAFLDISELYAEVDWQDDAPEGKKFIRIGGQASFEQAAEAVSRAAEVRQNSDAFVVTFAVKTQSQEQDGKTLEDIKATDIRQLVMEHLPETLTERFKELLERSKDYV